MNIALQVAAQIRGWISQAGDGGVATLQLAEGSMIAFTQGTGADQGNVCYVDKFSIAASGSLSLDLTGGTLIDRFGNALIFTAIKAILLIADAANVNNLVYGNGTNPFVGPLSAGTATVTLLPGNEMLVTNRSAAGWSIGVDAADIIKLANSGSGTAVTGTIVIIGEA